MSEFERDKSIMSEVDTSETKPLVKNTELVEKTMHDSKSELESKSYVSERFFKNLPPEKRESLWRSFKYLRERSLMTLDATRKRPGQRNYDISMEEFITELTQVFEEIPFKVDPYGNLKFETSRSDNIDEEDFYEEEIPSVVKLAIAQIIVSGAMSESEIMENLRIESIIRLVASKRRGIDKIDFDRSQDEELKRLLGEIGHVKFYDDGLDETFYIQADGKIIAETGHLNALEKRVMVGPHPKEMLDFDIRKMLGKKL